MMSRLLSIIYFVSKEIYKSLNLNKRNLLLHGKYTHFFRFIS